MYLISLVQLNLLMYKSGKCSEIALLEDFNKKELIYDIEKNNLGK